MNAILYFLTQIGEKILNIEDSIKSQKHKHKNKDYKFYKEMIENLDKNIKRNDRSKTLI